MKTVTVKKLVSKGVWNLLKVLENYGYNGNRWMVWERVEWMVWHSDLKYLRQRLLLTIYQFSESE